jgi:hypothetical protein
MLSVPRRYEIALRDRVDGAALRALGARETRVQAGETRIVVSIPDQHELHRLLERVAALGLELHGVRQLDQPPRPGHPRAVPKP